MDEQEGRWHSRQPTWLATALRDRAEAALDRAVETANVDFKESARWSTLKWKIIKTVLGMGEPQD
jgi:hypothetical protein